MGDAKDLTPGDYKLRCNFTEELNGQVIPRYMQGMHTPFKVT